MPALGAQSKDRWGSESLAVNHSKENVFQQYIRLRRAARLVFLSRDTTS